MPTAEHNLAIECSGRLGSVTLGRGDTRLDSAPIPEQQRHTVELMPTVDALLKKHGVTPRDLAELYLSIGPGSFTGLRIGVATARMLALTLGVRVAAVPTLDVLARNAPAGVTRIAPCLSLKNERVYAAVFREASGDWVVETPPALVTMEELLAASARPVAILGTPLPPLPTDEKLLRDVTVLPTDLAVPRSDVVWELGRRMAKQNAFTDPATLVPLYVRPPEAVELWDLKEKKENEKSNRA
ncbi:MAG: tRNA (adenosine(37)-N6)-threonylcarbamoyltransferase complex dimerization subunit type 1 TsaB [Planctomycetes bacterium]|nr:tRNA (adenosine(37)-N6)-threonylcarbamoyltransferase complex dimerization subunit type 1 TsaB [Planctomycetota bacterium]